MEPAPEIQAVFFDGYATLLHVQNPVERMRDELFQLGYTAPVPQLSIALKVEMHWYREHCHEAHDLAALTKLRHECARVFMESMERESGACIGLSIESVANALVHAFHFELFDDVLPSLSSLRTFQCKLGVISNWDYRLPEILNELGTGGAFDFVLTSATEGVRKPDPLIFQRALALASVDAENALHVGDDPQLDYEPAVACGIRSVLLDRAQTHERSEMEIITTLTQLTKFMR